MNITSLEDVSNNKKDDPLNFSYQLIKGKISETLIQELFLKCNYSVFRYGIENTIPGIFELTQTDRSNIPDEVRCMPDFIIQNKNTKEVFYIEVKYRFNGELHISELAECYPYKKTFFIIVSKNNIKCISYSELDSNKVKPIYLGNRKEFNLDKNIVDKFCDFVAKFYDNVD